MKQGDQEKKNHSLQQDQPISNNVGIIPFLIYQGDSRKQKSVHVDLVDPPQDDNVQDRNDDNHINQDAINSDNYKNVSSKPSKSPKRDDSNKAQQNNIMQGAALSDTQQQEAQPQFSTNPDQNIPHPIHSNQHAQQNSQNLLGQNDHNNLINNVNNSERQNDNRNQINYQPNQQSQNQVSNQNPNKSPLQNKNMNGHPSPNIQNSSQSQQQNQPGLVTRYGRQISNNRDLDLNIQKKNTQSNQLSDLKGSVISNINNDIQNTKSSFKNQRLSQDGTIQKLDSQMPLGFQRNPTMKIQKNQNNMAPASNTNFPKFSQQKTINLNFFDDLQLGFDNQSQQNLNYDQVSNSVINQGSNKPDIMFQDPNISVIYKNPKGSEFMDQQDYEDEKMYESREMGTPHALESGRNTQEQIINNFESNIITPPIINGIVKNKKHKVKKIESGSAALEIPASKRNSKNLDVNVEDFHNSELDLGTIHHRSHSHSSKGIIQNADVYDYNTQNKDSEMDDFIQKYNSNNLVKTHTIAQNDNNHLLKPKPRNFSKRKKSSNNNSKVHEVSDFEANQTLFQNRNLDNSVFHMNKDLDQSDLMKRVFNDINEKPQLDDKRARMMILNKLQDARHGDLIKSDFLMVVEKLPIEQVDDIEGRCKKIRQLLCLTRININALAYTIIKSKIFEAVSLLVIIANSVSLAIEDPTDNNTKPYQSTMDTMFLTLYTIEMALKIIGLGFLFNRNAYLRDAWNVLDFIIVVTAYIPLILQGGSVNLSGLRAFRVLRPLKSISSVDGLKVIVSALLSSLPLLRDTIIVLLFFFFIFAIAGLQLFSGYLKNRCVNIETGLLHPDGEVFCGFKDCDPGYFCGKRNENPDFDQTNFDTIFYALMVIFTSVTLEGWTTVMNNVGLSYTNLSPIFFVPLVFIGAFFLMNLTLAVIQSKFTQMHEAKAKEKAAGIIDKKIIELDYITYDHLDDNKKKQKAAAELEVRNKILRKWQMIIFIKERIKKQIKSFRERKAIEMSNKNKTSASTAAIEHGPQTNGMDYGQIFGGTMTKEFNNDNNYETDSQQNNSARFEIETQQSQRQLINSRNHKEIHLAPLSSEERPLKTYQTSKINIHNLKKLDQEAIAEDDDEYKTEFSNIIATNKHFSSQKLSGKNLRANSNGSRSTPKSGTAVADEIRRSSSRGSNFQNQIQFLQNPQSSKQHLDKIPINSPGKNIKLFGMLNMKKNQSNPSMKNKNTPNEVNTQGKKNIQNSNKQMQKKYSIDDQFFLDFVNHDLEVLEKVFSEQQLIEIAQKLESPSNSNETNNLLAIANADEMFDYQDNKFSEISILTEDYQTKQLQLMPQPRSNGPDEDNFDVKNQSPQTTATGMFVKSGNNFYRQKTKNTNTNFFQSQDLSISYDQDSDDFIKKEKNQANNNYNHKYKDKVNNESPQTSQSVTNDAYTSNEMLLVRQGTETTARNINLNNDIQGVKITAQDNIGKKTDSTATNYGNNLSQSNLTTVNQNGTLHSDVNMNKQKTTQLGQKRMLMGSSKVIPFGHITEDNINLKSKSTFRQRHGTNTITNGDEIPLDQSVLNSRFLIGEYLQKHQKIYLRKEQFNFEKAADDIFEQRDEQQKETIREQKRLAAITYAKNKIKPYQRKVSYQPKIYKPDEDALEYLQHLGMDAEQILQIIQEQYNEPYITNLHVTGTLSIAIHDKKDHRTNKTRKIQNLAFKQDSVDDQMNESVNQSFSVFNNVIGGTNNSINTISPLKRFKTGTTGGMQKQKTTMRTMKAEDQLVHDIKAEVFMKTTTNAMLSKSTRRRGNSMSLMQELRRKNNTNNETAVIDSQARRQILLKKAAAKDPELQRKLVLSGMNRDAYRSNIFRPVITKRKNRLTQEEIDSAPCIKGMLEIYQDEDEDGEDEDEEDDDSSSEDEADIIKDDFLDWPLDCKIEILKAKKKALSGKKNIVQWSGQDVLTDFDPQHVNSAIYQISNTRIWPKLPYGLWKKFKVPIKRFVKGPFFDNFMTLSVFINTVALALDKYGIDPTDQANLSIMNDIFTWIFICELSFKIIGLGPIKYFKDKMNYLDCMVVMLSIVEMTISSNSGTNLSAFRSIRIFRTFRVLRVARLLRSMQSMQVIIGVLIRSMDQFIYVLLLLLLFIFIYSLLGMQVFGGNYNFEENFTGPAGVPRTNYDNFNSAFLTTFQIMTLEGWPQLLFDALRSGVSQPITILFFISWVFLGNFMLLNLFLAILLDSFTAEAPHKNLGEVLDQKTKWRKHLEELEEKEGQELIEYYQETKDEGGDTKKSGLGQKKKKKKKKKDENMLDESFEYTKEALTKKVVTKKKKIDFDGNECELSFYFLRKSNKLRIYLYRMVSHTAFETVILILIILSSIKLVVDTYIYTYPDDDPIVVASANIDYFFTVVFALESVMKALAFGFIQDKGSYLRETWSQMDFFIVVTSLIDISFESVNLPIIKILRLLRTLRPLRFISHNSGMKTIVVALLGSVSGIFNVLIVVFVVWMMFGILAVNFFGGKMQYCTEDQFLHHNQNDCLRNRGQWKTQDYNFDNVPQAMITLFALATLEDWPDIMYNTINTQAIDTGPALNASPMNGYFFVAYILVGSFLFLNLFVGVIFKEFQEAQEEEKASLMLKDNQVKWVDMMKMIVNSNPDLETTNKPKQKWRAQIHKLMTGDSGNKINYVDIFVMICIVLNMFQMAINYEGSPKSYNKILDYINFFFTGVFGLECIMKLVAFDRTYFKTSWNVFDFCVVLASFFDIIMNQLSAASLKFLRVGPQLARVMRVMRVSRLFRLINKYKGLQALIQTITFSLPSLANVFSLLMLVYFIFAVLANFLFRNINSGYIIDENTNFNNFSTSFMTMIRMSTGEDWIYIMYDTMRLESDNCVPNQTCGISYAPVFFIPYIMVTQFIMLNLFIMVIIQQFELYYLQDDNILEKFKDQLIVFKKNWTKFTSDHDCLKLKDTKLVAFFRAMEAPLGMKDKADKEIIKDVVLMELQSDEDGFVYFHELLYRAMRRVYGEQHVKNKILVDHELRTMQRIESIKMKMKKKSHTLERTQAAQVNPFMLQMYMNISFKAWLKQYRLNFDKREAQKEYLSIHKNMDNFDLMSEESDVDHQDAEKSRMEKNLDEWEYLTEDDIECSDDEESYYEDDGSSYEDDHGADMDSSRMLRQKPLDEQTFSRNQSKLSSILKKNTNRSPNNTSHNKSLTIVKESLPSQQSRGQNIRTNESVPRSPKKKLSSKNSKQSLNIDEVQPKKRISTSQQPPDNRVQNQNNNLNDNNNNNVNKNDDNVFLNSINNNDLRVSTKQSGMALPQQFKFDLKLAEQSKQSPRLIFNTLQNSNDNVKLLNSQQKKSSLTLNANNNNNASGGGNSSRRRENNVIVSSRSGGSQGDIKDADSDNDNFNHPDNDMYRRSLKEEEEANDRIVLLKINMDSNIQIQDQNEMQKNNQNLSKRNNQNSNSKKQL